MAQNGTAKVAEDAPKVQSNELVDAALRRVNWVVPPLLLAANVMMLLDRGTLAFAALQMNAELGFDATTYGLAAGLFFLTYGILQVPSAVVGMRVGMRWWLGAQLVAWGVVAACTALVRTAEQLYVLRLLLGAAEAGAAPCCYALLSAFYPYERSAKPYAALFVAGQVSGVLSAPLAAALLSLDGHRGWAGWRWLFLIEGIPSVLLGFAVLVALPSSPLAAWWLPHDQREALHLEVHGASGADDARRPPTMREVRAWCAEACSKPLLWVFCAAAFLWVIGAFSLYMWIPIIISNLLAGTALSSATAGGGGTKNSVKATLLSTIPYVFAALSLLTVAWSADRTKEKTAHVAVPVIIAGALLSCFGAVARVSAPGGFALLTLSLGLAFAGQSTLVARAAGITRPSQAGITLGILNAICAALGGFAGPLVVGGIVRALGSFEVVAIVMGALLIAAGLIVMGVFVQERAALRAARARGDCSDAGCADWKREVQRPPEVELGLGGGGGCDSGGAPGARPRPAAAAAGTLSASAAAALVTRRE